MRLFGYARVLVSQQSLGNQVKALQAGIAEFGLIRRTALTASTSDSTANSDKYEVQSSAVKSKTNLVDSEDPRLPFVKSPPEMLRHC